MHLTRHWIEQNIPHHGRMCLLDEVMEWDAQHIRCGSGTHRLLNHPLRSNGRLGIACGIEYAAQTMAVHGALSGGASAGGAVAAGMVAAGAAAAGTVAGNTVTGNTVAGSTRPAAGFLAGLRDVRLYVLRLDDIETDLICEAVLVAGDRSTALYEFALWSEAQRLLSGRATVVFDANKWLNN
jgi:predicted hotdog family 3-hydroxylacyl-ACP dehydratase